MTRVRYVNKKTGWVSIYESTSCYDPVTKQSRPKRKYIGYEDPVTGEFIPSSGKAGRKSARASQTPSTSTASYQEKYKHAVQELEKQRSIITELKKQNNALSKQIPQTS